MKRFHILLVPIFLTTYFSITVFDEFSNDIFESKKLLVIPSSNGDEINGSGNIFDVPIPGNPPIIESSMQNYFYNLRDNFPYNFSGSCGIVSLSSILSYYDYIEHTNTIGSSYLFPNQSSQIVVDNINDFSTISSPGLKSINHNLNYNSLATIVPGLTKETYVSNFSSLYYDLFLIKKVNDYDSSNSFIYSIHQSDIYPFLNYLYPNKYSVDFASDTLLSSHYDSIDSARQSMMEQTIEFEQEVIQYIDLNIPVWLHIGGEIDMANDGSFVNRGNAATHAVVAYDYDIVDGDIKLYCHFGYHNQSTYLDYETYQISLIAGNYKYIRGYAVISPNQTDLCGHNKLYLHDDMDFCTCGVHTHSMYYTYRNATTHWVQCACGYRNYELHTSLFQNDCCSSWPDDGLPEIEIRPL